jgi:glucose-6-phosphate isomerase
MGVDHDALDALAWDGVFAELADMEAGGLANSDDQRQVGHYWLRAPELAPTPLQVGQIQSSMEAMRVFSEAVRAGRLRAFDGEAFSDVLHVGIGGSVLGASLLVAALDGDGLPVHFLDNTDPDGIGRVLDALGERLAHTLILVVSKSGITPETLNALHLTHHRMASLGIEVASNTVAITVEGTPLHDRALADKWLKTFFTWPWVGGRFSAFASVGLLAAALRGCDIERLRAGARDMDTWTRQTGWRNNPAALLAGCWFVAGKGRGERDLVVLPYADRLVLFPRYLQQLVMESIGKKHDRSGNVVEQGLVVYGYKGSTDQHAFVQQLRDGRDDSIIVFVQVLGDDSSVEVAPGIRVGDFLQGFLLGTRRALTDTGRPSVVVSVPRVDPYALGGLMALFERAVGLYASLLDVNAYDQPGV